jgi:hypothetical protein
MVEDPMTVVLGVDLVLEEMLLPPVMKEEEAHGESNLNFISRVGWRFGHRAFLEGLI